MKDWNQIIQEANENYSERADTTSTTNVIYNGKATVGAKTSDPIWQISRDNTQTLVTDWADGDDRFNNVWDNRTSLNYS